MATESGTAHHYNIDNILLLSEYTSNVGHAIFRSETEKPSDGLSQISARVQATSLS